MKKAIIISTVIFLISLTSAGIALSVRSKKPNLQTPTANLECQVKEITFYYLDQCEWCNKTKTEGILDKIENLGIKINKINAAIGPVKDKFTGVPTFVINGKVYEGYRPFDELKTLLGCTVQNDQTAQNPNQNENYPPPVQSISPSPILVPSITPQTNNDPSTQTQVLPSQDQNPNPDSSSSNINQNNSNTISPSPQALSLQTIKMDASSSGYKPNYFKVKAGIPVRWEITDTGTSGCTKAIIANGLFDGQISLNPGQVSIKEFTPTKAGKYQFSCWMGMITGIIEVE